MKIAAISQTYNRKQSDGVIFKPTQKAPKNMFNSIIYFLVICSR